ncbi:MAG: winged helix-turn-helix transcriptional regulator [Clostridia bacterium]|nr:winged helix-turn-helix transcriptional regulator [Clostridia bacterium]
MSTNQSDVLSAEDRSVTVQKTIHSFISADILHRRVIEQWACDAGMHRSQHRMLMYLSKCETIPSQKDLAKHFDISPAAVAVTLKKLESDGYIERGKCTERTDSRYNEIKITERGRDAAMQSRKYFQHVDGEALRDFSAEELALFMSLLERMQENLKNIAPLACEDGEIANTTRKETKE